MEDRNLLCMLDWARPQDVRQIGKSTKISVKVIKVNAVLTDPVYTVPPLMYVLNDKKKK